MIRYTVRCDKDHAFEGWFRDSAAFDKQARAGDVRCPECGSTKVEKALMAPSVAKSSRGGQQRTNVAGADAPSPDGPPAAAATPASESGDSATHYMGKVREALVEMRRHIEANADYVGDKFATEARKIHSGDGEERSIYGEASDADADALKDEGIEFGRIPWLPKTDA